MMSDVCCLMLMTVDNDADGIELGVENVMCSVKCAGEYLIPC